MKVSNAIRSQVMTIAAKLRKAGMTLSNALKTAWAKVKARFARTVTFTKKDGTTTTRNITTLVYAGGKSDKPRTAKQSATIKVVDLDKVRAGMPQFRCIISFHASQIVSFTY